MSDPKPAGIDAILAADVAEANAVDAALDAQAIALPPTMRSRLLRALPLAGVAALAVALVASGAYGQLEVDTLARHYDAIRAWTAAHAGLAVAGLVAAIATIVASGLPGGSVLVIASGLLFGPLAGAAMATAGNTVGTTVLYFAARRFFMGGGRPPPLVAKIRDGFARNPVSFAYFIRFVPVFPIGVASIALAWLGCRYRLFLAATLVGVLPSSFVYAFLGDGLGDTIAARAGFRPSLLAEPKFAVPLLALAVLALIPVLVKLRRKSDTR